MNSKTMAAIVFQGPPFLKVEGSLGLYFIILDPSLGVDYYFSQAYGGLRGAVAFSLVAMIDAKALPHQPMFLTTTLVVVLFTVFVQVHTCSINCCEVEIICILMC